MEIISHFQKHWKPRFKLSLINDPNQSERTNVLSEGRLGNLQEAVNRAANAGDEKTLRLLDATKAFKGKLSKGTPHKHKFELIEVANDILYQIQRWYSRQEKGLSPADRLPDRVRSKLEARLSKFESLYGASVATNGVLALSSRKEALAMDAQLNLLDIPRIGFKHLPGQMIDTTKRNIAFRLMKAARCIVPRKK